MWQQREGTLTPSASLCWWGLWVAGCETTGHPRDSTQVSLGNSARVFGRRVEDRSSLVARVLDSSARPDLCWCWTGIAASEQEGLGTDHGRKACDVLPSAASLVQVTLHKPNTNIQLEVANHGREIGSC